jgi:hypothetical protein
MTTVWSDLSPLRQWIISNKYWLKADVQNRSERSTHFLLDGGCIEIPDNQYGIFLSKLANDIQNNWKWFLCEKRTPVFKFMSDLDIFEENDLNLDDIVQIVKKIQICISENCGNYSVIGCTTEPKEVTVEGGKTVTKTGVHLIWPKLWVDRRTALWIRSKIITFLEDNFGLRPTWNPWEDVVDECVYNSNGLRMVGCNKCHPCKKCRGRSPEKNECEVCHGEGKIDEGRVYVPSFVLNSDCSSDDEYLSFLKKDIRVTLESTSIRNYCNFELSKLKNTDECSKWVVPIPKKKTNKVQKVLELDTPQAKKIQWCVEKVLPRYYRKARVTKITKDSDELIYVNTDTNYCMNVDRCHNSSDTYFEFTPQGIYQRCWCKKDTLEGRRRGRCRDYRSDIFEISPIARNVIFPEYKNNLKKKKKSEIIYTENESTFEKLSKYIEYLEKNILK